MDAKTDRVGWALSKALEGLAARQAAIAGNIANIDTPGYKASTVSFEQQLQRALRATEGDPSQQFEPATRVVTTSFRNDRNGVDIDQEMIALAETTAKFESITKLLGYRINMLRTIISDGRR